MGYVYCVLWILMAVLLFVKFRKTSKIIYILCAYFLYAGVWWFLNDFLHISMTTGIYGNILRGVSLGMLILLGITYFLERRKNLQKTPSKPESSESSALTDFDSEPDTLSD